MYLVVVVLPQPGPPVRIHTGAVADCITACLCPSDSLKSLPACPNIQCIYCLLFTCTMSSVRGKWKLCTTCNTLTQPDLRSTGVVTVMQTLGGCVDQNCTMLKQMWPIILRACQVQTYKSATQILSDHMLSMCRYSYVTVPTASGTCVVASHEVGDLLSVDRQGSPGCQLSQLACYHHLQPWSKQKLQLHR